MTVLHYACKYGHYDVVKHLVGHEAIDISKADAVSLEDLHEYYCPDSI